jgi:hypothetical protein
VRANGGYIIWWPATGLPVLRPAPLADWPQWLLDSLMSSLQPRPTPHIVVPDTCALSQLVRLVASAREGERNALTFWAACRAGEMVASGLLDADSAAAVIAEAAICAGLPRSEAERTARSDYIVGGLYTIAHWERAKSKVTLDRIRAALLEPVFVPFAGRACCSFALPFDPLIVEADGLVAAFAQRPMRPAIAELLRLKEQPAVEIAADEDGGLTNGRIVQLMDGYAGLRAWSARNHILMEIANG